MCEMMQLLPVLDSSSITGSNLYALNNTLNWRLKGTFKLCGSGQILVTPGTCSKLEVAQACHVTPASWANRENKPSRRRRTSKHVNFWPHIHSERPALEPCSLAVFLGTPLALDHCQSPSSSVGDSPGRSSPWESFKEASEPLS